MPTGENVPIEIEQHLGRHGKGRNPGEIEQHQSASAPPQFIPMATEDMATMAHPGGNAKIDDESR